MNERPAPAQIDLERLADRVYQLMVRDARLGRARGERVPHVRAGVRT